MVIMHICDNPACVNPAHLRIGSQQQNLEDMWAKARGRIAHHIGVNNPASKLTEMDVIHIRELAASGASFRGLARQFNLNRKTIAGIVRRETWKHI